MTRTYTPKEPIFEFPKPPKALTTPPLKPLQKAKTPLHEALGVSPEYTRAEYMKIVNQDENLAAKLKALTPLARELGLEQDPTIAATTQTIIFMMPTEISQKHHLVDIPKPSVIDV